MNEENRDTIDPQLEARLVALVLGEASDFERDELERLMMERPDVKAYCEEVRALSGLLTDIGAGEMPSTNAEWKLADKKRDAVLNVFAGKTVADSTALASTSNSTLAGNVTGGRTSFNRVLNAFWKRRFYVGLAGAAAVLLMVISVSMFQATPQTESAGVMPHVNDTVVMADQTSFQEQVRDLRDRRDALVSSRAKKELAAVKKSLAPSMSFRTATGGVQASQLSDLDRPTEPPAVRFQDDFGVNGAMDVDTPQMSKLNKGLESSGPDATVGERAPSESESSFYAFEGATVPQRRGGVVRVQPNSDATWGSTPLRSGLPENAESRSNDEWYGREPNSASIDAIDVESKEQRIAGSSDGEMNGGFADQSGQPMEADDSLLMMGGMGGMGGGGMGGGGYGGAYAPNGNQDGYKNSNASDQEVAAAPNYSGFAGNDGTDRGGWRYRSRLENEESLKESLVQGEQGQRQPIVQQNGRTDLGRRKSEQSLTVPQPTLGDLAVVDNSKSMNMPDAANKPQTWDEYSVEAVDGVWMDDFANGLGTDEAARGRGMSLQQPGSNRVGDNARYSLPAKPQAANSVDFQAFGNNYAEPASEIRRNEVAGKQVTGNLVADKKLSSNLVAGERTSKFMLHERRFEEDENRTFGYFVNESQVETKYSQSSPTTKLGFPITLNSATSPANPSWPKPIPTGLNEKNAAAEAFSTISLHVGDVSFKLAQSALSNGQWPDASSIRIEEFVNAFDYGDPMPGGEEKVACCVEQAAHPFLQQRNILRVSMRTAAAGRAADTPLRLTFLLDNSGSMERPDRQQTVRRAFESLAQQLKPTDQVTLNSFASQPRLIADQVNGSAANQLVETISNLPSEGGTNVEAALQLGFEKAIEQRMLGAQNRVVLLTDGAVNLGNANAESLSKMVSSMRDAGIAFDAAGISADGLNDEVLEALTRKGDGRYYLLDSEESADDGFAQQIAGALRPSAKNVKVQVEFNPDRVGNYKLLGFEKHRLNKEDFRNDKVDAAEMAAAEAGVAVYQFEAKPDGEGDVGSVSVRFQDLSSGQMVENRWPIPYQPDAPRTDQASPSLKVATTAAMLAAKLKEDPLGGTVELQKLTELVNGLPQQTRQASRVQQLQQMIQQAREISGG